MANGLPTGEWASRWFLAVEQVARGFPETPRPTPDDILQILKAEFPALWAETHDSLAEECLLCFVKTHLAAERVEKAGSRVIAFAIGGEYYRINFALKSTVEKIGREEYVLITGEDERP